MRRGFPLFVMMLVACVAALVACFSERDVPPSPASNVAAPARETPLRFDAARRSIVRRSDGVAVSFVGPAVEPTMRGARVEYAKDGVVEWYEPRPNGIEQGFTIAERPKSGALVVDVKTSDDVIATLTEDGATVDLRRASDETATFRYGALSAVDAKERVLPSKLSMAGEHTIRIEVDDAQATYPVTIDPLIWALQQKLTRIDSLLSRFGVSVAVDGDTLVTGANSYKIFEGSFFVFRRANGAWNEEAFVPAPYSSDQNLGINTALEGDRAFVGTVRTGLFFTRVGKTWTLEQALPRTNPQVSFGGVIGAPIAMQGTRAVVSVPDWAPPAEDGGPSPLGTLFVYELTNKIWTPTATIRSPEPISQSSYGTVALDGDRLAFSSGAHVFVFRRDGAAWMLEATLSGDDALLFGNGLAFCGNQLLVGDPSFHAAYVFELANGTWTRKQKLDPPTIPVFDAFGNRIVCKGDDAFIADPDRAWGGSVFRYVRSAGAWSLAEEIRPADLSASSAFGLSLAYDGTTAAFGAPFQGANRGAVYVYAKANALGDACSASASCSTGHCVDGVCCESECGGGVESDCLRCDGEGARGLCRPAAAERVCRPSTGECDVEERCDGARTTCPHDAVLANGTLCTGGTCVASACRASDPAPPPSSPPNDRVYFRGGCSSGTSSEASWPVGVVFALAALLVLVLRRRRGAAILGFTAIACSSVPKSEEPIEAKSSALVWGQKQKIPAPANTPTGAFGGFLSLSGSTLAAAHIDPTTRVGRVYVLGRVGNQWLEQAVIAEPEPGKEFSRSLSLDGDTLLVGAPANQNGAAFVFTRTNGVWTQQAKLVPPDPTGSDKFGMAVALAGDRAIIGAPEHANDGGPMFFGAAYVFRRTNGVWAVEAKLGGHPNTRFFGASLAADGDRLVVGATAPNAFNPTPNSATFFLRTGTTWNVEHVAFTEVGGIGFGVHVALAGDVAVVGAPIPTIAFPLPGGAAYVYRRANATWTNVQKLRAADTSEFDRFGHRVVVSNGRLAIGALGTDGKGAVYLFSPNGDLWQQSEKLQALDLDLDANFGQDLALTSDMLLVAAPGQSQAKGAIYSMFLGAQGDACTTSEPCAFGFCVDGVCCNEACGGGDPNDCLACSVATGAATNGICAPITRVCRPAINECDVAEACDGKRAECPVDEVARNGLVCGAGKGTCSGGTCLDVIPVNAPATPPPIAADPIAADGGCSVVHGTSAPHGGLFVMLLVLASRRRRRS